MHGACPCESNPAAGRVFPEQFTVFLSHTSTIRPTIKPRGALAQRLMISTYQPARCADGVLVLSISPTFLCKTTDDYERERTVAWNEPKIGIRWLVVMETCLRRMRLGAPLGRRRCLRASRGYG
jgi:dTDP-4-dehydrorhamnose 3,5-epimerase